MLAGPGPPCHCEVVDAGPVKAPVSEGTRRACLLLAVGGTLVLMTGVLLAAVSAVLGQFEPGGWVLPSVISAGLITAGLFCGVVMLATSARDSSWGTTLMTHQAPAPPAPGLPAHMTGPPMAAAPGGYPAVSQGGQPEWPPGDSAAGAA
jgi:hypothetical protein